jgi:4a-hydroxytetrahydrobiopterin dehydratase
MTDFEPIMPSEFLASPGVEDWRILCDGILAFFPTSSFAESARFVEAIAALEEAAQHQPAVDVRAAGVTVRLISVSDDWFGPSREDAELAASISRLARYRGLRSQPERLQRMLVIPGAVDISTITPFWRAALGYDPRPDSPAEDLVDPADRDPAFWFEGMDQPRGDGKGAIHVAVWLPTELAEARVAAALAAGGTLISDAAAPSWWTLADAAGNEVCIGTIAGRG